MDNLESAEDGDEDVWFQMARKLEDVGITSTMVNENCSYITAWIKDALRSGSLGECVRSPSSDSRAYLAMNGALRSKAS